MLILAVHDKTLKWQICFSVNVIIFSSDVMENEVIEIVDNFFIERTNILCEPVKCYFSLI